MFPVGKVVDLHHRPVDAEGVIPPVLPDLLNVPDDLLDVVVGLVLRDDLEAQALDEIQRIAVGGKGLALHLLDIENEDVQPTLGGNLRVLLAKGPGGGVSGVLKGLLPRQLLGLHHPLKAFHRHINLPPDLQKGELVRQLEGHRADSPDVLGDVLPGKAVAPGGTHCQHPVPVLQGDRKAVDLGFHHIGGMGNRLPYPAVEVP